MGLHVPSQVSLAADGLSAHCAVYSGLNMMDE